MLFLLLLLAASSLARNVDHTEFLQKYGYLPRGSNQLSSESLTAALKSMQRMAGLEETGELDERTKRMMERPRCGHPDVDEEKGSRGKRHMPQFKWNEKKITYGPASQCPPITSPLRQLTHSPIPSHSHPLLPQSSHLFSFYSTPLRYVDPLVLLVVMLIHKHHNLQERVDRPSLPISKIIAWCKSVGTSTRVTLDDLRRTMRQAAVQWSELADVEIVESAAAKPMIQISAGRAMHYPCTVPFDSMTLAHAFFPPHGQIHINDNVKFAMRNFTERTGENSLYSVVAHEMGHALGFSHSPDSNSVMFAYDTPRQWTFTAMDKYRMQMYYGTKKTKTKMPEKEVERGETKEKTRGKEKEHEKDFIRPDECRVENPVVVFYRGEYLAFKSQWVWRISSDWKRLISKATLIDQLFPGLPGPIDAAVTVEQNLWCFVGDQIFVIRGNRILHAPIRLSEIGINEKYVDLAYEWHYFNPPAIYIWKGSKYWRLDENLYYRKVDERYPKDIELNWARVPKGVHSAFTYQKEIHFLRNDQVYRMNSSRSVFDVANGFPRQFRSMFGFCPRNERLILNNFSKSFYHLFFTLILCLLF